MIIQMCIKNQLGDFTSEKMDVTEDQYKELVDISRSFYSAEKGFEMWLEDGFMVMSPEMAKKSILSLIIIEYDKQGNSEEQV
jgi:hypothetical protein